MSSQNAAIDEDRSKAEGRRSGGARLRALRVWLIALRDHGAVCARLPGPGRRRPGFAPGASPGLPDRSPEWALSRHGLAAPAPSRARALRRSRAGSPGELLHFDIKSSDASCGPVTASLHDRRDQVRGAGWEYVHVCIDDASRLAFAQIMPDEGQDSAVLFLERALAYFGFSRHQSSAAHERQRLLLSFPSLPRRLSAPSPPPHFYPPLHPTH